MKLATHQRELLNRCSSSSSVITLMTTGVFFGLAWSCFFLVLMRHTAAVFCWWYIVVYAGVQCFLALRHIFDIVTYKNMCLWVFGDYELAERQKAHNSIFKLTINAATCSAQVALSLRLLTHAGVLLACLVANWWILFCVYAFVVLAQTILSITCEILVRSYVKSVTPKYIFSDNKEPSPYTCAKDLFPEGFMWTPKVMASATIPVKNTTPSRKTRRVRFKP